MGQRDRLPYSGTFAANAPKLPLGIDIDAPHSLIVGQQHRICAMRTIAAETTTAEKTSAQEIPETNPIVEKTLH
ncbi:MULTISPECIES: hypothetical protein [unclassified Bifidobacterium]|uniref:hypothetical protein n=1 Tax=unclassified Bifidobacterium TaxID=2608897 RepID=UPI0015E2B5F4|nr:MULTISPECIES: hypothetical protein [unclassified Bifidobacterium]